MDFLKDLKVSFKLVILLLIALFAMTLIGYTGYYYLQQSNVDMKGMYKERLIPVKDISMIRTDVARANAAVMELMITTDDAKNAELKKIIDDTVKTANELFVAIENSNLDAKGKELVAKTQISKQKYRDARENVIQLAMQNKNAEAYALYTGSVEPLTAAYMNNLKEFLEYYSTLSERTNVETQASFEKAIQIAVGIFIVSLLLLIVSGLYISNSITKPLNSMVATCKELSLGDFRDKPRQVIRKDEIGQVADALADTRSAVRNLLKTINESSEQLAASSEELTASSEQSALAANQVAESINSVAVGAEKQSVVANTTSDVVQKISTNIQQVAVSANDVAGQSAQAASKANDGNHSVEKAILQMDNIEKTVTSSAQVVSKLGERSKEIGQIVDTISGIAGQTNLLALNAAIEAARAGEQGRGFAVVAEEVRKLAEQSQEAAKQIALLISEIQGDTDQAVVAMNAGTHEVKLGAEVVNASGYAFKEIATLVAAVSSQIKDISTSIEDMSIGSQQIVKSVQEIDGLSKTVSGEAQTVSAATEEQSATMEEIASASQTLSVMAMDLQKAVHTFQI